MLNKSTTHNQHFAFSSMTVKSPDSYREIVLKNLKSKIHKSKILLGFPNVPFNAVVFEGERKLCGGVHEWREISI
jgi:hypothetical protein